MNKRRVLLFATLLGMLGSCGNAQSKPAATQAEAASACSGRAQALFSGISDGQYELIVEPRIRSTTDGHFVFEQDGLGNPDPTKPLLVCEGSLRDRVIESIALDGDVKRAHAGQTWSF